MKIENKAGAEGGSAVGCSSWLGGCLWLDVEVTPGSGIENACRDAVMLADKLGLTVWFDFNGVKCGARPGDDWQLLLANWSGVMESKSTCKVACANPPNDPSSATGA